MTRPSVSELARIVVEREVSLFQRDIETSAATLANRFTGSNVLVVGGAGSIGSATTRELMKFAPASVCVVDVNENGLAELLRDLRSSGAATGASIRAVPLDFGSLTMERVLEAYGPFDAVLNFAAVKHVRSERDVASLLHMLDVNVRKADVLLGLLQVNSPGAPYFAVSTDKAANPVNLMGCSKRVMELMMFRPDIAAAPVTSARFANVAFSDGSLLDSWLHRLDKRQPWAVPGGTRRYFVTPEESGQLCLIAAGTAPDRSVVYPALDPATALQDLQAVAERVLRVLGLEPLLVRTEQEALAAMPAALRGGPYPLLVTALDTVGEKEYEEFVGDGDVEADFAFGAVRALRPPPPDAELNDFLVWLSQALDDPRQPLTKGDVMDRLASVVPELRHRAGSSSLDDRM